MRKSLLSYYILKSYGRRRFANGIMFALLGATALLLLVPLFSAFWYVIRQGLPALNWSFFTELPKPVGEIGGGMANALLGTLTLDLLAILVGVPWGLAAGIYLSEFGRGKLGSFVRFTTDILSSVPSIVVGLFAYALIVMPMKRFSAIAGAAALAMIMVPIVARGTEELLKLVPLTLREAGLALGIPRWKVIWHIVVKGSVRPLTTAVMLALARITGETAPLIFTAFNNRFWATRIDQPMSSLPVQIYTYAISPFEDWHRQAWAGAFVLLIVVFSVNLITRTVMRTARTS